MVLTKALVALAILGSTLLVALGANPALAGKAVPNGSSQTSQNSGAIAMPWDPTSILGSASAGYLVECYDETQLHFSSLQLDDADEIDELRCVRGTYGDFVFDASTDAANLSIIHMIVLPWIEYVGGDVRVVDNNPTFDTIRLPRLSYIGGMLDLDFRQAFEGMRLPALTHADAVDVTMRTMDLDVTGLDALVEIDGRLKLHNPNPTLPPTLRGLAGLTEVGSLSVSGHGVRDDISGLAMSNLTVVKGNVSITVESHNNPPADYNAIYATHAIQTVCGSITITGDETNVNLVSDFASLDHVVGAFTMNGDDVSDQIPGLSTGGSPPACQ